jgi:hypothetical protein
MIKTLRKPLGHEQARKGESARLATAWLSVAAVP